MARSLDVLMIGWEYPPHNSGGLGVACEGLTKALVGNNTHISFTLPYKHGMSIDHMDVLTCVSGGAFPSGDPNQAPFSAYTHMATNNNGIPLAFDPKNLRKMPLQEMEYRVEQYANSIWSKVQQRGDPADVIHAHDWMTYPAARLLRKKLKKPFVAHIHSTEFDRVPHGEGNGYIAHQEYLGLKDADRVIAVSELTKQVLIQKYQIDPEKIDVVHNGINAAPKMESLRFADDRPLIVFMGRLTMQKGAEYFLQLARSVLQEIPEALFIVAGHGDQYHMLLLENAKSQLSSSVLFAGFLRDQQKDFLLDRANVFVMPSISEPFGLVALEAVQRDTPVIISQTSGVKEVLPGAIVVDFWDIDAMTKHILRLIQDETYHSSILNQQLQDIAHVTWENSAEKVKSIYRKILNNKK